jgi:hypothetical protein
METRRPVAYIHSGISFSLSLKAAFLLQKLDELPKYSYGENHPMKPKRLGYTNDLVLNYDLYEKMLVLVNDPYFYNFVLFFGGEEFEDFFVFIRGLLFFLAGTTHCDH